MAQTVTNLPAMQETWVRSLGWEDPLEKRKLHAPVLFLGNPMDRGAGGLQSMELQRVGQLSD